MLHIQTEEAVAYKPTLARPLAKNPHYGVGEGRCSGCEQSIVRRSCGRTTSSRWAARYILLYIPLRFVAVRLCCLADTILSTRPSTLGIWVRSRRSLGVERAARAEAARVDGRCWGGSMLTMLSTSTAAVYIYSVYVVHIRYHVRGTWYLVQGTDRRSLYSGVCGMWSLVFCGLRIIRKK